jgi:chitodextrinase
MGGAARTLGRLPGGIGPACLTLLGPLLLAGLVLSAAPGPYGATETHEPSSPAHLAAVSAPLARAEGPNKGLRAAPAPAAGFTLGSSGRSPTALALNWTEETFDFANYTLERSPNGSAGSWTTVTVVTTDTTTSYVDSELTPGSTNYWEVVEATGLFGTTTSNTLEVQQPSIALLTYTTPTPTSAQFNWTNGATYGSGIVFGAYVVFEQVSGGPPGAVATITVGATRTYTVQGLSSATSYAFYVNTSDCIGGCGVDPVYATTQSTVVTFGTPQPLTASASALREVIDTGQSDLLTCSYSGGESPFTFEWNSGNGTFVLGGVELSVSYATPGPESVQCRVTDYGHVQATSTPTVVTVDPPPSLSVTTNRSVADADQPISYTCSAANGTAPVVLTWSFGDGIGASGGLTTHSYASSGSYLAACSAEDGTGTVVQRSTTLTIDPVVQLSATVSSPNAAPGSALTFTALPVNGSGDYSNYTWTFGDGAVAFTASATHAFLASGPYTAHVSVADSNGGRASAQVSVTIVPLVNTVTYTPRSALVGQSIAFEAHPMGGAGGPFNVTWTFGDGAVLYGANVTHPFSASGIYNVSVVVTDSLGAENTTVLPAIDVTTPSAPAPWFTTIDALALLVLVLLVVIVVAVVVRRRRTAAALDRVQGRVPPTDPNEVKKGAKICRNCGTTNLPLRETCISCGRPLRRSL